MNSIKGWGLPSRIGEHQPVEYALAAACDELEEVGACAVATPQGPGEWTVRVVYRKQTLVEFTTGNVNGRFPGHAVGGSLIERGWAVRPCAHSAPDRRPSGWKEDPRYPKRWTAPVAQLEQDEES